jgi:hypothetical protein
MMNRKLIGAVALSLLIATPALAKPQAGYHRYGYSHRASPMHVLNFGHRSVYDAYGFDTGGGLTSGNVSGDFDRRNTFN